MSVTINGIAVSQDYEKSIMKKAATFHSIIAALIMVASGTIGIAFAQVPYMNSSSTTGPSTTEAANLLTFTNSTHVVSTAQPRLINHSMGVTEIIGTPERIVVIDMITSEFLYELGVKPVGVGSPQFLEIWFPEIHSNWSDVTPVGENFEPNFEAIAQLEPDLIIGAQFAHSEIYDMLNDIAPTILTDVNPEQGGPTEFEAIQQTTMMMADALNRHNAGMALVERMNAEFEENAVKIEAAGLNGSKFILAAGWVLLDEDKPNLSVAAPNSGNAQILERIGLINAVPMPEEFDRFGDVYPGLEGLTTLDGPYVHFIYFSSATGNPFESYWKDNPVWNNLSFVKDGRLYHMGVANYNGGPMNRIEFADKVVELLLAGKQ